MYNNGKIKYDEKTDNLNTKTYIFPSETEKDNKYVLSPLIFTKNIKIILVIILIFFLFINQLFIKKDINSNNKSNFSNFTNSTEFTSSTDNINITKIIINSNNINFSNFTYIEDENTTIIKPIALYYSKQYSIKDKNNILKNPANLQKIKNQIYIAKNNSIYGFGIYYYWEPKREIFNDPLDILIEYRDLNITFFLIFRNDKKQKILIYENKKFILNIVNYIFDQRYIRIEHKPVIGVYNPEDTPNLKESILLWREISQTLGIGEIYILAACTGKNIEKLDQMNLFNAFFDLTSYDSIGPAKHRRILYYFYFFLLHNNLNLHGTYNKTNSTIYRSSEILSQFPITPKGKNIYSDYTIQKYSFLNKIIIDWTRNQYEYNRYIFINAFDNNYLDKNKHVGYESLKSLSLALNENPIKEKIYNLSNLENNCLVAIQAHVFYLDLLNDIINKTNNIPVKFDLYITTDTEEKKNSIEDYVRNYTKANKYEILVVENRGRDVLPLFTQFKNLTNKYKYFCHIHTKKSETNPKLGVNWQNYLYENLLGSKEIISEILSDFENSDKLGFIYPTTYSEVLRYTIEEVNNLKNLNELLKKYKLKAGKKFDFPAGNMFWARSKAVHQVFSININNLCPKEPIKKDGTIMHAIERIWVFIVKLNGYTFKETLDFVQ